MGGRPIHLRVFSILNIVLLSACSAPSYLADPSQDLATHFQYAQALNELKAIDWPNDHWWQRYDDAQLNALVNEALRSSPDMQVAQARLKYAQGMAQQAGALNKPNVGMAASASESKVSYAYQAYMPPENWNDYGSVGLDFSYDFDFWGKNKALIESAQFDYAAAQAQQRAAALDIKHHTLDLLTKRYDNGLETQVAVSQARSTAALVEADLLSIQEAIALQKNALAALLGSGPDRGLSLSRPTLVFSTAVGIPDDLALGLLGHRADISIARWHAQAAANRIDYAKAQFYPDIKLSAFIGYQSFGLNNLFNSGNDAGNVGAAIYLPLFSGGRLEGQLTVAESHYEEAVALYNATLIQALQEVANAITSNQKLSARIAKMQEAVDAASVAYQTSRHRYSGGLSTYLDVLTAENALINSQQALVNLESRSFSLDVALIHALGSGYHSTLL
ncbi:efflux transporter outer membrane subunit [Vibrio anguillarum]|uniref:efflux transporter outer membrane subunit n=1 Tax=Vibrio anguillarum TaxID=55601 RepID=UPI00169146BA|nr:efflux transporter outer membrane subunit [Vibrio anguillarum]MCC4236897.1 efflux transporter outer membrane subunit [Vibrio anguillarum]MDT3845829.1 efflux transporter outer membrane subunit [Vibrio anguillarum]NOI05616.1 efflux transporter outer membrane subunit [Vibrio anguillarum]